MKFQLKSILSIFIVALLFTSCSDDEVIDTEKPGITLLEPHNEDQIAPGDELHVEVTFTDNVELAAYKIEIHEDFDEHTHAVLKTSHDLNPWSEDKTFTIPAGKTSHQAIHSFSIPTEINGMHVSEGAYHLGIFATDTSGNQEEVFVTIHIESHTEEHVH